MLALGYTKKDIVNEFYESEKILLMFNLKNGKQNLIRKPRAKIFLKVVDAKNGKVVIKLGDK